MSCTDKMYLTGNEICSDNPRDLSDNARVFDAYVNSAEFSVTDRFGIERVTLAWAKWRVDNAIDEATGEIRAEWQTGVANINSEETNALNNINTTTTASLTSIEEAKDNAIEEIIETGGTTIVQEPGQDINKVMSQKAVTDFVNNKEVEVPVDQIFSFESENGIAPAGYIIRKGQVIDEATMPKLFARYGSKMPDDRDRVHRMTGTLAGNVGTTQEDAIRNITGDFECTHGWGGDGESGAFYKNNNKQGAGGGANTGWNFMFDASRVVPTADENRVKSRIVIFCNKIQ